MTQMKRAKSRPSKPTTLPNNPNTKKDYVMEIITPHQKMQLSGGMPETMTSLEIAEVVNKRHDNVKRTIETLAEQGVIIRPQIEDEQSTDAMGRSRLTQVYRVGERDSYVIVAQLSPEFTAKLVDYWQQHKNQQPVAIPTTAEAFANAFQMIANTERTQVVHAKAIAHLEAKVERVATAQTIMPSRPSNAEGITHARQRLNRIYGLSANIVDEVMRQSPYAPKPAGMVRNDHVDAGGVPYAVYWTKDITKTFDRFVDECEPVTPFMFTHPFIEGRFRIARKTMVA
jgi:phage regulator Rha-like protein